MPALIPALIVGGVGAAISSNASNNAAKAAENAAAQNNALQSQIYTQNSANAQPYIQAGNTANTALQGFLGLGGDPAASQKAFNDYLNSTGYQFNRDQGNEAVQQAKASSGMLNSGSTLKALDAYGTGLADQYGQQYEQNLSGVADRGASAVNALTGAGQGYANAVSSNNNSAVSAKATAVQTNANAFNSLVGHALALTGLPRSTSFSAPSAYNALAPGG